MVKGYKEIFIRYRKSQKKRARSRNCRLLMLHLVNLFLLFTFLNIQLSPSYYQINLYHENPHSYSSMTAVSIAASMYLGYTDDFTSKIEIIEVFRQDRISTKAFDRVSELHKKNRITSSPNENIVYSSNGTLGYPIYYYLSFRIFGFNREAPKKTWSLLFLLTFLIYISCFFRKAEALVLLAVCFTAYNLISVQYGLRYFGFYAVRSFPVLAFFPFFGIVMLHWFNVRGLKSIFGYFINICLLLFFIQIREDAKLFLWSGILLLIYLIYKNWQKKKKIKLYLFLLVGTLLMDWGSYQVLFHGLAHPHYTDKYRETRNDTIWHTAFLGLGCEKDNNPWNIHVNDSFGVKIEEYSEFRESSTTNNPQFNYYENIRKEFLKRLEEAPDWFAFTYGKRFFGSFFFSVRELTAILVNHPHTVMVIGLMIFSVLMCPREVLFFQRSFNPENLLVFLVPTVGSVFPTMVYCLVSTYAHLNIFLVLLVFLFIIFWLTFQVKWWIWDGVTKFRKRYGH
jgi:hypothetical protein